MKISEKNVDFLHFFLDKVPLTVILMIDERESRKLIKYWCFTPFQKT